MKCWVNKAFYLGDADDGVFFVVRKSGKGKYKVKALGKDTTGETTEELKVPGVYDSYKEAMAAAVEAACGWCRKKCAWVEQSAVDALKKKTGSRAVAGCP